MQSDDKTPDQRKAQRFREELRALFRKHDCSIGRAFIFPAIQIPIMITFFAGLRRMAEVFPDYSSGGLLWFQVRGAAVPSLFVACESLAHRPRQPRGVVDHVPR